MNNSEKVCDANSNLNSPSEDLDGNLYLVTQHGEVLKSKDGHTIVDYKGSGQYSGVAVDKTGKILYVADLAKQDILKIMVEDKTTTSLIKGNKDYDDVKLLGPHSLVVSSSKNHLFFTDAGSFEATSLERPKGSLYVMELDGQILRPLASNCLAYPTGLALSLNEKNIYVCETCSNRLLRFSLNSKGVYHFSVFHQFYGRFGPTAVAVSSSNNIYVARFDFSSNANDGIVTVLNPQGQQLTEIHIPYAPEITGLVFSRLKPNIMYMTENSAAPSCIRVLVQLEESQEGGKQKLDVSHLK